MADRRQDIIVAKLYERVKWSIPEVYRATEFRSKLEASWARFLDRHGILWDYEGEGFRFGDVCYLPDFHLPDLRTVLEVKGLLDTDDVTKLYAFTEHAERAGVLTILAEAPAGLNARSLHADRGTLRYDDAVVFARCEVCREWGYRDDVSLCRACGAEYAPLLLHSTLTHMLDGHAAPHEVTLGSDLVRLEGRLCGTCNMGCQRVEFLSPPP